MGVQVPSLAPNKESTRRGAFFVWLVKKKGLELGASNLKVAYSPKGEKTVQWTVLREAREKQVPYGVPKNSVHASVRNFYLLPLHFSLFTKLACTEF